MLAALPLIATAFTSCSNEELNNPDGCAPMTVNVTNNIPSRATADIVEETTLPANAQIGVSVLTGDGAAYGTGYANVLYTTTDGIAWETTDVPQLSATPAKAVAYYPYAEGTAYDNITVTTEAQKDVMYSEWVTGLSNANANATFQMKHALAAVRLVVKQDGNFPADTKLASVTLESDAFIASAKLNAATGTLTGHTGTATLSHEPDVALTTAGTTLDFITVPGTEAKTITFTATIGEKQYTASTTPANPLAQGKIHTYTLNLSAAGASLSSVAVTEWGTGEGDDLELEPYIPNVPKVYAVSADGSLIDYTTADNSCVGVALHVTGKNFEHKFMIAKSDATDGTNTTLYWGKNLYQKEWLVSPIFHQAPIISVKARNTAQTLLLGLPVLL